MNMDAAVIEPIKLPHGAELFQNPATKVSLSDSESLAYRIGRVIVRNNNRLQ